MTATIRNYTSATTTSGTNSTTITLNSFSDMKEGELLLAFLNLPVGTVTPPAGWELVGSFTASTGNQSELWQKRVTSSEPASYTWTSSITSAIVGSLLCISGANGILQWDALTQTSDTTPNTRQLDAARDSMSLKVLAWRDAATATFSGVSGEIIDTVTANSGSTIFRGMVVAGRSPGGNLSTVDDTINAGDSEINATWTPSAGTIDYSIGWIVLLDNALPDEEEWSSTEGDFTVELELDRIEMGSNSSISSPLRGDVTGLVETITSSGDNPPNEIDDNLADGLTTTKWLVSGDSGWVQYDFGSGNAKTVKRYRLAAANDNRVRDPMDWTLKGSNNGTDFTDLDVRKGVGFGSRYEVQEFRVSSPGEYRYYRLDISSNFSPASATSVQLSEWRLSVHDTWEDVTERVRWDDKIRITRGFQGAAGRHDFSRAYFTLKNPDGLFSISNPDSPYYGSLQRNTRVRISKPYGGQALQLQGAVALAGTNMIGDCVRTPLTDDLMITGDIDVRIDLHPESWRDEQMLAGVDSQQTDFFGTVESWAFYLDDNGLLNWTNTPSGGSAVTFTSTRAVPNAGRQAVRVTLDVSVATATFYISDSMTGSWTQLGDAVTASATSIGYTGGALCVGHVGGKDQRGIHGRVFGFELRDGIDGTLVADLDFTQPPVDTFNRTASSGWGTASSGLEWTTSGGSASDYSVSGGMGRLTHTTAGVRRIATLAPATDDADLYATFMMPSLPVGDSAYAMLASRYTDVNNQYFARVQVTTAGASTLTLRERVSGTETQLSTVAGPAIVAGNRYRVRFQVTGTTLRAKLWKESDGEPASWSTTTTDASLSSGAVGLWSTTGGSITTPFTVAFDDFRVAAGLEGMQQDSAARSFETAGRKWTAINNAVISNRRYRFHGEVSEWPMYWDTTGTDVNVPVTAAGIQKRLERGSSELSALYRHHTKGVISNPGAFERFAEPVAYWPCEDLKDTVRISSAIPNAPHMEVYGSPEFENYSDFPGSRPLPMLKNAQLGGRIGPIPRTGYVDIRWVMHVPETIATNSVILSVYTVGTMRKWEIVYTGTNEWTVKGYDEEGVESNTVTHGTAALPVTTIGQQMYCQFTLDDSGGNINYGLDVWNPYGARLGGDDGLTQFGGESFVRVSRVNVNSGTTKMNEVIVGHIAVYSSEDSPPASVVLGASRREAAGARLARLAAEEDVEYRYVGAEAQSALLGGQDTDSPFPLMSTCSVSDEGYLTDPLDAFGLEYRTGRSLYNQAPHLTLSYTSNYLSGELTPSPDDSHIVNDFTASRGEAGSARFRRDDGPLSVSNPPDGVGEYAGSQSYSFAHEGQCVQMASWQVHKGTLEEARYPRIQIALENPRVAADPELVEAILTLDVGRRVDITDLPAFLPPDDIRQIVIGYEEWFDNFQHDFTLNTLPERVYEIAEYDAGDNIDTYDTVLYGDHSDTATELTVLTSTGPAMTYDPQAYPFDIRVNGEVMRVLAPGSMVTPNPLFTDGVTGWTVSSGAVTSSTDYVFPYDPLAVASAKFTPAGAGAASEDMASALSGVGTVQPGRDYIVSGWFYSPAGHADIRPAVHWYNSASTFLSSEGDAQDALPAGRWTFLQDTVTAPANASQVKARGRIGGTPSSSDVFYAWNLKVTEATPMYGNDTADSFNRADSTTTPGSTDQGSTRAWTEDLGAWGISSNRAYISAAGNSIMTITGAYDFEELSVEVPTWGADDAWLIFRCTDVNNRVRWGGTVGSRPQLQVINAGAIAVDLSPDVNLATTERILAAGDRLSVRCQGSVIECFLNGKLILSVSDETEQGTRVGLQVDTTAIRFDNFTFIESEATQQIQVERGVGTDAYHHKSESGVSLYRPPYRGL